MSHPIHEFQLYSIAADRHCRLLADAATYRQVAALSSRTGRWRRFSWALGDLLLAAGARLTAGRPATATPIHNSFI